jgi:hypothetical protein
MKTTILSPLITVVAIFGVGCGTSVGDADDTAANGNHLGIPQSRTVLNRVPAAY